MLEQDPLTALLFWIIPIYCCALGGRYLAQKYQQPGVLGELLMGVLLGNLGYFLGSHLLVVLREGAAIFPITKNLLAGIPLPMAVKNVLKPPYATQMIIALQQPQGINWVKIAYAFDIFSRFGVIFLLFMVGLESSVKELKVRGKESIFVAVIGVIAPLFFGFIVAHFFLPQEKTATQLFIAATLSATSVAITARVLKDFKKIQTREAQTILGAAMLDDILGLVLLAIVSGMVVNNEVSFSIIFKIICASVAFFILVFLLGSWLLRRLVLRLKFLEIWEAKLILAFLVLMFLSWLAASIHLATIVGAFVAGIIIHDGYFKEYPKKEASLTIRQLILPLETILAPLFFILMGIQVKLEAMLQWPVIVLAALLIMAAVLGKIVSGLGANSKDDRLLIGIGMLPRGEVGLIFASIGKTLGILSDTLFSAMVLMILMTSLITPPLLKMRYNSKRYRIVQS